MGSKGWKEKAKEFFPWEDENKKKKPERGDSIPPKTSLRAKLHSKPKVAGQEYLDMYLMMKEKERWEKYGKNIAKSQERAGDSWKDMKKEIKRTGGQLPEHPEGVLKTPEEEEKQKKESKKSPRNVKTVDWNY